MPLHEHAAHLIRANLKALQLGKRVPRIIIGTLTDAQVAAINEARANYGNPQPPITADVLFVGKHIYERRCLANGYTIEDVVDQITSAMDSAAVFIPTATFAAIQNWTPREDRYGNKVCDRAVLDCSKHHPRPELYSVTPKGDYIKPPKKVKAAL
jgi:hypothetical protein